MLIGVACGSHLITRQLIARASQPMIGAWRSSCAGQGEIAHGGTTVAVQDGRVVAFIALREARVAYLYVDPEHWRQAIGGALLRRAQAVRPRGLDLWVFGRNAVAIAFYERHGFRIAELTNGSGNEEREPDARMVWP